MAELTDQEVKSENVNISKSRQQSIQSQILEIVPVIVELIILLFYIFYYIGESAYRLIYPLKPKDVKGETVLVTGAGHGIGKELALKYASEGARVVCWDINEENNKKTVEEIESLGYPKAVGYKCDVSKREDVLEVAEKVKKEVGDVTILINNAGIMPSHSFEDHTPEEISRMFGINVMAHFWTIEAFLPGMKKRNQGHIVCLSSIAGLCGLVNLVPYCATKFAVRGLMEALSEELRLNPKNNIHTTVICPYMVNTGLCQKPIIKFPSLMPLLEPKYVAEAIMNSQRNNIKETTIPNYLMTINNVARGLPDKAALKIRDFFESGVASDK